MCTLSTPTYICQLARSAQRWIPRVLRRVDGENFHFGIRFRVVYSATAKKSMCRKHEIRRARQFYPHDKIQRQSHLFQCIITCAADETVAHRVDSPQRVRTVEKTHITNRQLYNPWATKSEHMARQLMRPCCVLTRVKLHTHTLLLLLLLSRYAGLKVCLYAEVLRGVNPIELLGENLTILMTFFFSLLTVTPE